MNTREQPADDAATTPGTPVWLDPATVSTPSHLRFRAPLALVDAGFERLKQMQAESRLPNVTLVERVEHNDLEALLSAADVWLIPYRKCAAGVSVPSRFYNLLAVGRPVILVSEPEAEAALTVTENSLGWVVLPGMPDQLADVIRSASRSPDPSVAERAVAVQLAEREARRAAGAVAALLRLLRRALTRARRALRGGARSFRGHELLEGERGGGVDARVTGDGWAAGYTALHLAAAVGGEAEVRQLVAAGADVGATVDDWMWRRTALGVAAACGRVGVLRVLVELGVDVNAGCGAYGETALMAAAKCGREAAVAVLLDMGAAIDQLDGDGYSALHCAMQHKRDAVARLLIARRADVNVRSRFGDTPLILAARDGDACCVAMLLAAAADVHRAREQIDVILQRSTEAFPAVTLGL